MNYRLYQDLSDDMEIFIKKENPILKSKWIDPKINVLIPMAGLGSRFEKDGYSLPKPLIKINQKPMIQVAVENLNIEANYIYVVQKQHREKYNLDNLFNLITPGCTIIETDGLTEGAACSALLAKQYINNNNPLFIANSDQFVEWDLKEFMLKMNKTDVDGGIATFNSTNPHFSYAKIDGSGIVQAVSRSEPISDVAITGYYYWKNGSDFVKYVEQMISKDIRFKNEFHVDPLYTDAVKDGKKIQIFKVERFWSLGTPEELKFFLEFYENS
jgi:dTDP-glucose pyrophosphorylase